jgi:hypothetical protein
MGSVFKEYRKDMIAAGLLETALELYFSKHDGFSVILLAGASEEVLSGMIKGKRDPNNVAQLSEQTAREKEILGLKAIHAAFAKGRTESTERTEKEIGTYLNYVRNQAKHHDPKKDPNVIALDLETEVKGALFRAIENFVLYFENPSPSMVRFLNQLPKT